MQEVIADIGSAREVGDVVKVVDLMEKEEDKFVFSKIYMHAEKQIADLNVNRCLPRRTPAGMGLSD